MRKIGLYIIFLVFISCNSGTIENEIKENQSIISNTFLERVEPPNWWIGFKNDTLQLLVKEDNIGNAKPTISYNGITINKVIKQKVITIYLLI